MNRETMKWKLNNELYRRCKAKGLKINHVCEVGVYLPETSNILEFILEGVKTTLVEPDPKNVKAIQTFFKNGDHIRLYPFAVYEYNGVIELSQRESSTFVNSLPSSPALVNDRYVHDPADDFEVECKTFDMLDDGTIDLLSVDTEGCEWYVIKNMKSRPAVISLETHGKSYINPFISEITEWLESNQYTVWFKDDSDSVFVQRQLIDVTLHDTLQLKAKELTLSLNRLKYRVKRVLTGA